MLCFNFLSCLRKVVGRVRYINEHKIHNLAYVKGSVSLNYNYMCICVYGLCTVCVHKKHTYIYMGRTFRRLTEYVEDVDFENAMKQEKYD